ncbi:MAG: hypothetical protein OEZ29_03655 [Candidatus Bathyarchaeota archaeon]|nr:hypothetical protein [Candidatus Bathyarchaeota archaeon]
MGGFILYLLALLPLRLFNYPVILSVLILCSSISIYIIATNLKSKKTILFTNRFDLFEQLLVLSIFFIVFLLLCTPLTNFVFGSIHDTSLHALFTQLILENQQLPETHLPYVPAAVIFPQGPHPIFAFASIITGMIPPLSVFHVTQLFNAMTVLAAYHFGKYFIKSKWGGISLAFTFAFVSTMPFLVAWGSNGFVLGFSWFFIVTTFVNCAHNISRFDVANRIMLLLVLGVLLGYLAALHLSFLMVLGTFWFIDVVIRRGRLSEVLRRVSHVLVSLSIGLVPILPFVVRFILYYPLPGHNIGLPADIENRYEAALPMYSPRLTFFGLIGFLLNILSMDNVSPHIITRLIFVALSFFVVAIAIKKAARNGNLFALERFALKMIFAVGLVIFSAILIPEITQFSEYSRFGFILFVPLISLFGVFNLRIYRKLRVYVSGGFSFGSRRLGALLILLVFVSIYGPFVYHRTIDDAHVLAGHFNVYAVTTQDDYDLMLWIKNNLPQNASILVNPFESGLFIPSISQRKIVYPFSAYHFGHNYSQLTYLLSNGILNCTTFDYMDSLEITHVYVGVRKSNVPTQNLTDAKWYPHLFLGNPNFALTKRYGDAYLFAYDKKDDSKALLDSFEYNQLSDGGWQITGSPESDGEGKCTISSQHVFSDLRNCEIKFRNVDAPSWISIYRRIFVSNTSNVMISFHLKEAEGFGPEDALLLIVSNVSWGNKVCFTAGYVPLPFEHIPLPNNVDGYFEFNISQLWETIFNEALPQSFIIQILCYDADRVENVAYVDAVSVSYGENHIFADHSVIIREDFEYSNYSIGGWFFHAPEEAQGIGHVATSNLQSYNGNRSLEIRSQKTNGSWYWCSAIKSLSLYDIYSDVNLSFHLNATKGFNENDTLMIVISDLSWSHQIYLSTNPRINVSRPLVPITDIMGHFEFNIGRIWADFYAEPLPETFFLQLMNYDTDGIQNIVYLDEIIVRAR